MQAGRIIQFLKDVSANNNREWFHAHKAEYEVVKKDFEEGIGKAIVRISAFDPSIAHLGVRDCTYRFYRDTRFSPDKSPYKNHFGAYIAAHGKKALHGGYYIHLEPDNCMLAIGGYWLPTNILTSCRNEIMMRIDEFEKLVELPMGMKKSFPEGFGFERLKTCPVGFPRDFRRVDYLRAKDYGASVNVPDNFFEGDGWLEKLEDVFGPAKPFMDFINEVIDDYE
jgi:uncharacterized protein (TIGR02453 family)